MFKLFFQQDGYRPREVEDALLPRLLVFLTVAVAIFATTYCAMSPGSLSLTALLVTFLGSWLSWHRRRAKNWWIKLILALLMMVALANFMLEISQNIFDARIPLAHLLIWLQVLHSFDLPRRKDLFYSLWVALILISVAATLSRDGSFSYFLMPYALFALSSLFASHLSSQQVPWPKPVLGARLLLPVMGLSLAGALLAYVFMPRYEGLKFQSFPVSLQIKNLPVFQGEIKNKAYNKGAQTGSKNQNRAKNRKQNGFDPMAYYGFSTELDLNYRGKLSDEIVMRVRSNRPNYWRGMAFDVYDGQAWSMTWPMKLSRLENSQSPIWIRETRNLKQNIVPRERLIQTFYIEKDQSNLIFHAPYAEFIYFPTTYVLRDEYASLRSPIELFEGTAYTVISEIPVFSEQKLRQLSWEQLSKQPQDPVYYRVPENFSPRTKALARQITRHSQGPYAAVRDLEAYLKQNYPYRLDIPEFPENVDTVDYFLFQQKAGYCEHFASSLTLMARSLGLPARLVTGYTAGTYNPITGYFEVRSSDAHGWTEIYFPYQGWVSFDATPGYLAYRAQPTVYQENNASQLAKFFAALLPQGLKNALGAVTAFLVGLLGGGLQLLGLLFKSFSLSVLITGVVLLIGLILVGVFLWSRWARRAVSPLWIPAYAQEKIRKALIERYLNHLSEWERLLGIETDLALTPRERVAALARMQSVLAESLVPLTERYYALRYDLRNTNSADFVCFEQELAGVEAQLKQGTFASGVLPR
ncbi:hypothetical protein COW36_23450 [bacterium (Candidatus Blackallbacteria) CG17_big_fil_post_rev_8_21_14_2_50_48_46]|uniref:Transglutaminase-like domain-containing protein n=1 Tax=bacterium (Candidatus Blackallbacteria) CG17_big_fil_post_rev_8_21_14_2_50_48_46 TaxID=2014261 RepID=A0A2M7FY08_9BACT|nr:MAG: hypothetical protein COW64_17660 [bacterium (Candidatus Blackallbacteria) CG18_big_fil_WC_8_21_14_2_50_49_26]PIW13999.1 MAG: hypothetical protein COW36_23450 [bacterium (Candidatus Blackallbacteria) CG17_big_fil_post_rev_8_21_14_2_50_48_46]PIW46849.1 MAG: hypothetical protein COW20_14625 [bacterium (Candidatus Blackallbacteria) CG13_big_fil_rev_8_21_14_2_50_49_14]